MISYFWQKALSRTQYGTMKKNMYKLLYFAFLNSMFCTVQYIWAGQIYLVDTVLEAPLPLCLLTIYGHSGEIES
jgi:hypothetical protein